jgi:SAM-dependent methyltransferase
MHWRLKGAIQKLLGHVPGGERIHYLLQRRGGGLSDFGSECDSKVEDWALMMGHLLTASISVRGARLLEVGTGWYPTFPFCLYLSGAGTVLTLDLHRHLDAALVQNLADRLARHVGRIALVAGLPEADVTAKQVALARALRRGASLEAATGGVVHYQAPGDATATGLPANSLDVVFSNSVLEHVPAPVIDGLVAEAMRILRPGGIAFHSVNCGDHYAYVDRSIHQLHYLQYSEAQWRKWNNAFLYQNRLRAVDFTDMARRAGFGIDIDTSRARAERLAQLDAMEVDPSCARYTREQLAVTSIDFVARKPSLAIAAGIDRPSRRGRRRGAIHGRRAGA